MSKRDGDDLNDSDVKINPDEDDIVCAICQDGDVYEGNEIIFCDKCNVPVHQVCYGVDTLPEGEWFCNPCEANEDPTALACALCSNHGGAYKPTEKNGQWVHSLCAFWIPEIFTTKIRDVPTFTLSSLDKKRFKLHCNLCKTKGACIQCAYGRCAVAAHPYCVLTKPQGFTRRTIKDEHGELLWEVFCKPHAHAVSEPLKPKPKSKLQEMSLFEEVEEEVVYETVVVKKGKNEGKGKEDSKNKLLSMSHALKFSMGSSVGTRSGLVNYRQASVLHDDDEEDEEDDDDDDDDEDDKKKNKKGRAGKGKSLPPTTRSSSTQALQTASSVQSYPVHTMSEWPGQTEGEAMDLFHFWNVVSMSFPEDHTSEWVKYMLDNLNDGVESCEATASSRVGPCASASSGAPSAQAVDELERRLSAVGSDKDRWLLLDLDKRSNFLSNTDRNLQSIEKINAKLRSLDMDQLKVLVDTLSLAAFNTATAQRAEAVESQLVPSSSSSGPTFPVPQVNHIPALLDENSFLVAKVGTEEIDEQLDVPSDDGIVMLKVAIDGAQRLGAQLQVRLRPSEGNNKNASDWTTVSLDGSSEEPMINGMPAKLLLIGPDTSGNVNVDDQLSAVEVRLLKSTTIDNADLVVLPDKEIISKSEDDMMARMIKSSQHMLQNLTGSISESFQLFDKLQFLDSAADRQAQRQEWTKLEAAYLKQRVWRKVASTMLRGVKDQKPDFNKAIDEAVPASWTIKVDGRPVAKDDAPEDEEEPQEDAVCMVCFDGSSNDNNKIIFCDGCNVALHQVCYGIAEVPEGDYYCDRCEAVQAIASDSADDLTPEEAKEAIKCCLCPQHHGGIKATTDGRWVHLCCAVWAGDSIITDLSDMGPIDVSKVPVQVPEVDLTSATRSHLTPSPNEFAQRFPLSTHSGVCSVCNVRGGYVTSCSDSCSTVFHPLCAWFRGLYFRSELIDPSFRGNDRNGLYPSGVKFDILCADHSAKFDAPTITPIPAADATSSSSSSSSSSAVSPDIVPTATLDPREEQRAIRDKYRIKEFDLEYVPGKGGRRRKHKKQKASAGRSDRATVINKVKDLARDVYDASKCACCFVPFDTSPFVDTPQVAPPVDAASVPAVADSVEESSSGAPVVDGVNGEAVIKVEPGVASNVDAAAEPSKEKRSFESLLQAYEAICLECSNVVLPKVLTPPTEPTTDAQVPDATSEEQQTSSAANGDDGEDTTGVETPAAKRGRKPKSKETPAKIRFSDRVKEEGYEIGSPPQTLDAADGVIMDVDLDKDELSRELVNEANMRKYEEFPEKITCQKCQIVLHMKCAFPSREILNAAMFDPNQWTCAPCAAEVADPRCAFCPRRGGFFRATRTESWIHQHCVLRSPGNTRVQIDGVVEIVGIPKESKKHLCILCNRKEGVFSRCAGLGCTTFFHSLCGERSGRVYSKIRFGELLQYCHEHVPDGVERTPQGWWIDEAELFRLHYVLDRSRLIVDMLSRRDKFKRNLCKTEADIFRRRFYRSLDKAKGRKYQDPDGLGGGEGDSEDEYDDDDEDDLMAGGFAATPEQVKAGKVGRWNKKPCWQDQPPESDITTKTAGGLRVDISGSFVRGDDVKVPALLEVAVAGAVITKRFVKNKEDESLQRISEAIQTNPNLFMSQKDRDTFLKDLRSVLSTVATLPDKQFRTEISKHLNRLPEEKRVEFDFLQGGRRDRSQPAPEPPSKATSSSKTGAGRKRRNDDEEEDDAPVAKSGKSHMKQEKVDASVIEDKSGKKKKTVVEDPTDSKKAGGKTGTLDNWLVKAAPVPKRSAPAVNFPLPQYITTVSAERELKSNPLFASLDLAFSDGGIDFSSIAALSGLDALVAPTNLDWELCDTPEKLIRLEARILDILNEIDSHEVPVNAPRDSSSNAPTASASSAGRSSDRKRTAAVFYQPGASGSTSESRHGRSPSSSPAQPMRYLAGEFTEIPDDQIPDYDQFVRRRLTLATLKKRLLRHKYLYMAAFEKDFYELLNNGIYVTEGDSETRADAVALAKLFQAAKLKSLNPHGLTSSRSGGQAGLTVKAVGARAKKGKGPVPIAPCAHCDETFEVTGWPDSVALPKQYEGPAASSTVPSGDWQWMCPPCVLEQGAGLIDKKVQVWWRDDAQYYQGVVRAYDAASERHCVLYDDREWEFINLGTEPVLLSQGKIKAGSVSSMANGKGK